MKDSSGRGGVAKTGAGGRQGAAWKRPVSAGPTASAGAGVGKIAPARLAAFEILKLVGEGKGHSDELLHSAGMETLSQEDRHLTTALVMGGLRWQIALEARARGLLQRPEQGLGGAGGGGAGGDCAAVGGVSTAASASDSGACGAGGERGALPGGG